jgi:hypothetical protein
MTRDPNGTLFVGTRSAGNVYGSALRQANKSKTDDWER